MKRLLTESNFIETPQASKARRLKVDVFGSINKDKIAEKVVEIAKEKAKELPVIIILSKIEECELIEDMFAECFIFGKGRVS